MEHKNCKPSNFTQPSEFIKEGKMLRCPACGCRKPIATETSYKKKTKSRY